MMKYAAKLRRGDDVWLVSFPEFPNVNTYGETKEEALHNASEALNAAIESDFERGFDMPEPKKYRGSEFHQVSVLAHIEIACLLRQLRGERPQTEIARQLNVSYQAYQKLENPRRCNPTIKTLEKISEAFGKELEIKLD
jgi:antitoxin HicB